MSKMSSASATIPLKNNVAALYQWFAEIGLALNPDKSMLDGNINFSDQVKNMWKASLFHIHMLKQIHLSLEKRRQTLLVLLFTRESAMPIYCTFACHLTFWQAAVGTKHICTHHYSCFPVGVTTCTSVFWTNCSLS